MSFALSPAPRPVTDVVELNVLVLDIVELRGSVLGVDVVKELESGLRELVANLDEVVVGRGEVVVSRAVVVMAINLVVVEKRIACVVQTPGELHTLGELHLILSLQQNSFVPSKQS